MIFWFGIWFNLFTVEVTTVKATCRQEPGKNNSSQSDACTHIEKTENNIFQNISSKIYFNY